MLMTKDDLNAITQALNKEVKKAVEKILDANKQAEEEKKDYFKETEKLLYSYPSLKLKVEQDEEDLNNNQMVLKRKSADVVRYGGGGGAFHDMEADYLKSRKASMDRTKREIARINKALETIKDDKYYNIIPLKYFEGIEPEKIASAIPCDERTYRRNKNRLINKLKIVLFGSDALQ